MKIRIGQTFREAWAKTALAGITVLALHVGGAVATTEDSSSGGQAAPVAETLDAFIEREMAEKMQEFNVVGATLALVHDGKLIYARGFGHADVESGRKVAVEDTLFRWGSISKTFTWTAIMQLVEQGKISLEADVNDYLGDVSIPPAFDGPIRVKHLLAHSPGFEDGGIGYLFEEDPEDVITLKEYLLRYLPRRVRPAGAVSAYSNYGSALAGHIIENVSGMSFEAYLRAHIFEPLGMTDTTFLEPLPETFSDVMSPDLSARVSKGFKAGEDGFRQFDRFTFLTQVAPAGGISSTAIDMAKFARAHLENCALDGVRILQPDTCALMHSVLVPLNAGGKNTIKYGFFQDSSILGHDRFWHNGGTTFFHSMMSLYPDLNFAFLLSTNTDTGPQLYLHMEKAIVERMFGDNTVVPEAVTPPKDFADRAEKYEGYYLVTRRNYSTIEAVFSLFQGSVKVAVDADGYLAINQGTEPVKAVEVEPNLFRTVDKEEYFEFVEDESGAVVYLKILSSFDKVAWYQVPQNRALLLGATLAFLISGLVAVAVRSLARFARQDSPVVQSARRRLLASLSAWVVFVVALVAGVLLLHAEDSLVTEFPSPLVVAALAVGIVACLVALLPTWSAVQLWRVGAWSRMWRCYYSLLVLAVWLLVVQLNALHVIGFNYVN